MKITYLTAVICALSSTLFGAARSSSNYSIVADVADAGGRRSMSANYTNDGSLGLVAGLSAVAAPAEIAKHGYIGQLTEIAGLLIGATSTTIEEGGTLPLSAAQLLDDTTTIGVPSSSVTWSVAAGPLAGISVSGVVAAGLVYRDTAATAQGILAGNISTLSLNILNVGTDDFGAYAGDGLDDAWQTQYFGLPPNALAAPSADPDGDGQDNRFEFVAGIVPTDPDSRFDFAIDAVPGLPNQKALSFGPLVADRSYTVTAKTSLMAPTWSQINASTPSDNGDTRTITDLDASGTPKFYHVEITRP